MSIIDKAEWHYNAPSFPREIEPKCGGTHIGVFIAWLIHRDLGSAHLRRLAGEEWQAVIERRSSGRELLFHKLDEKFTERMLRPKFVSFVRWYYCKERFFTDFSESLPPSIASVYHSDDSWALFDTVAGQCDRAFAEWSALPDSHRRYDADTDPSVTRYVDVISHVLAVLPTNPEYAAELLEQFADEEPSAHQGAMARREAARIRARYGSATTAKRPDQE